MTGGTIRTTNVINNATLGTAALTVNGNVTLGFAAPATAFNLACDNDVTILTGNLYLLVNTSVTGNGGTFTLSP